MNNYHLYEEIGHGKFSKVYKGRKKFTIRFVAVKSFEKSRREKVLTEAEILSKLSHPNVLGFVNMYETRNHLWAIFEYCAGGDLLRLLKQDGSLPEDQVRIFGGDICAGLLHVHSRGIVYADLKPANILFDENETLKLCDFGQAQRVEAIERALAEGRQPPRKGSPQYMAPELFLDGGIHSFASDLWSLGCVLFELHWRAAIQLCVPSAAAASRALWGASTCEGFLRLRGPESAAAAEISGRTGRLA